MSIEATEYVKGLRVCPDGATLTRNQKLLLFVLADYHNVKTQTAWPSLCTLADDSLLSLAHVKRELVYLRSHGAIRHVPGGGRGHITEYAFPGLEKQAHLDEPVTKSETGSKQAQGKPETGSKQAQGTQRNKEEPVEPLNPELASKSLYELQVIAKTLGRDGNEPASVMAEIERRTNGNQATAAATASR